MKTSQHPFSRPFFPPQLLLLLLLLTLSPQLSTQTCLQTFKNIRQEHVETGYFGIQRASTYRGYWEYKMVYKEAFTGKLPRLGLSIGFIEGYRDDDGVDFLLKAESGMQYFNTTFKINYRAFWVKAYINYIASSRQDFLTGTIQLPISSQILLSTTPTQPKTFKISQSLPSPPKTPYPCKYTAFVSIIGFKSEQTTLQLQIDQQSVRLDNYKLVFVVRVDRKLKSVQMFLVAFFGYIRGGEIWVGREGGAGIWGVEEVVRGFQGGSKEVQDILGIVGFQGQNEGTNLKFSLTKQKQPNKSFLQTFNLKNFGKIHPNLYPLPMPPCLTPKSCLEHGGALTTLNNGKIGCEMCSYNEEFNKEKQICVCKSNCERIGESCVRVDYYGVGLRDRNGCDPGKFQRYSFMELRCVCMRYFQQRINQAKEPVCAPSCPKHIPYNQLTQQCICPKPTHFQKDNCSPCRSHSQWDPYKKQCMCVSNSKTNSLGQCIPCSPMAKFDAESNECVCKNGTQGDGVLCRIGDGLE